jgi:hypothetical protein
VVLDFSTNGAVVVVTVVYFGVVVTIVYAGVNTCLVVVSVTWTFYLIYPSADNLLLNKVKVGLLLISDLTKASTLLNKIGLITPNLDLKSAMCLSKAY